MDGLSTSSWALESETSRNMFDEKLNSGKSVENLHNSKARERGTSIASSFDFGLNGSWMDHDTKSFRDGERKHLRRSMGHSTSAAQLQQLNNLMGSIYLPGDVFKPAPALFPAPAALSPPALFPFPLPPHAAVPQEAPRDGGSQAVLSAMTALQNRIKYQNDERDEMDRDLAGARVEIERWKHKDTHHQRIEHDNASSLRELQEQLKAAQEQLDISRKELAHAKADRKLLNANYAILEKGNKHQTMSSHGMIAQLQADLAEARMQLDQAQSERDDLERNLEVRASQLAVEELRKKQVEMDEMQKQMNCHLELVETQKVLHDSVQRLIEENNRLTERVGELERPYSANIKYGTRACGGDLALVRAGHSPRRHKRSRSARRNGPPKKMRSSSSQRSTAKRSIKRSRSARGGSGNKVRRDLWSSYRRSPPFILGTSAKPSHSAPVNIQVHSRKSPWHKQRTRRQMSDRRPRSCRARMQNCVSQAHAPTIRALRDAPIRAEIAPPAESPTPANEKQQIVENLDCEMRTLRRKYELLLRDTPKQAGFLSDEIKRLIFELEEKAMELSTLRAQAAP